MDGFESPGTDATTDGVSVGPSFCGRAKEILDSSRVLTISPSEVIMLRIEQRGSVRESRGHNTEVLTRLLASREKNWRDGGLRGMKQSNHSF